MNAEAASEVLHVRVRAMVRAYERAQSPPEPFDDVAADLARFQASFVPGYRRLCLAHGVDPASITLARQAPAVPTDAFRLGRVFAFNDDAAAVAFRTSGTAPGGRGVHRMRTTRTYDAAALAFGRAMLAQEVSGPFTVIVIGPSPAEASDSSLAHMCALFAGAFGEREAAHRTFFVRNGSLDLETLRRRVDDLVEAKPAIVLATSFALVHLLDALGDEVLCLPPRSRVMQTGGFKGKSREIAPAELRTAVGRAFGVDGRAIIGEYGMTELSSQFWEQTLVDRGALHGTYAEPPWARVIPVDPDTLTPARPGAVGIARIEDLANVDSAFAVVTQDLVRRVRDGFEIVGRSVGAPARGCSIALDEMLSRKAWA